MKCFIVISAYNEEKYIGRLLEGIRQQTLKDVEMTLVDSSSTDQTVSVAAGFGAGILQIPSVEFTFGRSLNFGLWAATRERALWKNVASTFWFRFMQFHGARMGYRETSLVTPQLCETFYYARELRSKYDDKRDIEPIRYNEN